MFSKESMYINDVNIECMLLSDKYSIGKSAVSTLLAIKIT